MKKLMTLLFRLFHLFQTAYNERFRPFPAPEPEDYEYVYGFQYQFSYLSCEIADKYGKKIQEGYIFRKHKITHIWETQTESGVWRLSSENEIEALNGKKEASIYYEKLPQ